MFRKKKYSEKVKVKADEWLKQFNSSLENLKEDQQEIVLEHVKKLRLKKWLWLSFIIGFILLIEGVYGCFVSMECIQQNMETAALIGMNHMDPSLLKQTIFFQYYMAGICFSHFVMAVFIFLTIPMYLIDCKKREKILKAFLIHHKS